MTSFYFGAKINVIIKQLSDYLASNYDKIKLSPRFFMMKCFVTKTFGENFDDEQAIVTQSFCDEWCVTNIFNSQIYC